MLGALPADLVQRFEREGWMLVRNYNEDFGASVEEAFGTADRGEVERYCRANATEFEWQPDGTLRTWQRRSAVVRHPVTGQRCWFNQIAFLNEQTIDPEVREYLVDLYGHDLSAASAAGFRGYLEQSGTTAQITVHQDTGPLIRSSDLVIFATIAGQPHVSDLSWFEHNPLVLHVSLRDLAPQILLASTNIVDDVEHCLKADTSPHLAERLTGNRDFLAGTLDDVMAGRVTIPADRPTVFSPFGLGVLDLAVGKYVYDEITRSGELHVIDDFFHELSRYG